MLIDIDVVVVATAVVVEVFNDAKLGVDHSTATIVRVYPGSNHIDNNN